MMASSVDLFALTCLWVRSGREAGYDVQLDFLKHFVMTGVSAGGLGGGRSLKLLMAGFLGRGIIVADWRHWIWTGTG